MTGTSDTDVSKGLSGLTPGTTYHYRVAGTNASGTTNGADMTFTTLNPPSAATDAASSISATGATLNGMVNANGYPLVVLMLYYI